uniref:Uncharacterized protein LOC108949411 n=1 Tax=Phallusia mammillata TaxID=59560 RepID=A0A6F9DJ69_9ASCI|nr:uncharacterized protein LOC108949411 [Phallusia mammillata]
MMVFNETPASSYRLSTAKHVSNAVFHFIVALSLYSSIGAVCERWMALIRIKPHMYLCKVSNPIIELKTKMKMNRNSVKELRYSISCLSRLPLLLYLLLSWAASFVLAVVSVIYGQERFLLYGDHLQNRVDEFHPLSSFFTIPANRIRTMTIIYILMLFVPAVFLVICIVATSIALLKTKNNAMRLNSYEQAQALVYFQSRQESKPTSDVKTVDRLARNSSLRVSQGRVNTVSCKENVSYSHKQEHTQQVMSNCQEADLSAIITDSIQMHQNAGANKSLDTRMPLPPDWLKYPSIKRSDTMASTVKVEDLATTPLSVPYDSAVSFFGEITEAKATLCTYSVVYLLMLPVYSLIAVDVFGDPTGVLNLEMPYSALQWYNASGVPSYDILHVVSFTTTDFAVIFMFLYMFAGTLPFCLMASLSPSFKRAAKQNLKCPSCRKSKPNITNEKISLDAVSSRRNKETSRSRQQRRDDISRRRRTPRKSWMNNHADYWQAFSRRSQIPPDHTWRPTKRPRSSYIDNTVNIDERFEEEI